MSTAFIEIHFNTTRVSNISDLDQHRHFVCTDLDPNCLQRLPANDKFKAVSSKERVKTGLLTINEPRHVISNKMAF